MIMTKRMSLIALSMLLVGSANAFEAEKVASELNIPWGLAYIDDNTMLVSERAGLLKQVNLKTGSQQVIAKPTMFGLKGKAVYSILPYRRLQPTRFTLLIAKTLKARGQRRWLKPVIKMAS
ncbi:PQQ-dependent sugar dehydrogenase [Shewanella halifaxensis]|uniref:PQQ-dependent sugar dehydrogenase n=1 Tax=Shewanella halifaxensis TaxID=271098 RepID=UPI001F1D7D0F|nr:PQQ-dependent sugar dehydrogenase [Shewanella halifaxensis]